ncbi:MAG: adenosine deaminase, partial [Proteobacteria bacterium]|nr:adenosine deaminase [Pseudomonadota bacterium]
MRNLLIACCLLWPLSGSADWFEDLKSTATDEQLHQLLYEMPKGGNLHHHMSGEVFSEWWYDLAIAAGEQGYRYYTKVRINNCREQGEAGWDDYLLHYGNLLEANWLKLSDCEKAEYVRLEDLTPAQKRQWLNGVRLDKPFEGRNEFFEKHWQRLGDISANPWIGAEIILKNFQAYADEGLIYLEPQVTPMGFIDVDGNRIPPDEIAAYYRSRLEEKAFRDTGMTYRFQIAILRFLPQAEEHLKRAYRFAAENEPWVAINMVGREDDDKGYPLRFLDTIRELRQQYSGVRLSIHAGEVDEPNDHVRDTLLLGADRIGHGLNLITDDDTMRLMRHGPYMVEINLISNLLLEYIDDYSQHPFPEYLRIGIPVALSTDDRGMWDSTMTDEFFVAVKEFNLSWEEVKTLSRNSLKYAFVPEDTRTALLETYDARIRGFERKMAKSGLKGLQDKTAPKRGFVCRR